MRKHENVKKKRKLRKMQNSEKRKIAKTLKLQKTRKWKNVHFQIKDIIFSAKIQRMIGF